MLIFCFFKRRTSSIGRADSEVIPKAHVPRLRKPAQKDSQWQFDELHCGKQQYTGVVSLFYIPIIYVITLDW